jgi:hypothetical protein
LQSFFSLPLALGAFAFAVDAFAATAPPLSREVAINAPSAGNDDWQFSVGIPGWLAGLNGDFGVRGMNPVHVDVPFKEILQNLEIGAMLRADAQHGKWGFYVEGIYLKLGADGKPPGPLLNSIDMQIQQVLAEVGMSYRLWEGKRGYFDLLVGARYVYMGGTINFDLNSSGVQDLSQQVSAEVVNQASIKVKQKAASEVAQVKADAANALAAERARVAAAVEAAESRVSSAVTTAEGRVSNAKVEIRNNARTLIVDEATARIQSSLDSALEKYPRLPALIGRTGPVSDAIRALVDAQVTAKEAEVEAAKANANARVQEERDAADARVQTAKEKADARIQAARQAARDEVNAKVQSASARARNAKAKAESAVKKAEQKLAHQIEKVIKEAIPNEVSGSKSWVDPFIGFRARYNLTDSLYLAARADIGGFGVSSKLAWQAFGAVGYQLNKHWSTELGYRYLSIDYNRGGFVFDAAMAGAFVGLTYTF